MTSPSFEQLALRILAGLHGHAGADDLAAVFLRDVRALVPFDQGACIIAPLTRRTRVAAVSNVTTIDQGSPHSVWLKRMFRVLTKAGAYGALPAEALAGDLDPSRYAPGRILFLPFDLRAGGRGAFVFARQTDWSEQEIGILRGMVASAAVHLGFLGRGDPAVLKKIARPKTAAILAALMAAAIFPVKLSSVAPAEVVALEPSVVSSSMQGVVKAVHVRPNDPVTKGHLLVTLDDVEQRAKLALARRDLELTEAELRRFEQMGFLDPSQRFRLAELEGQRRIRLAEAERAETELDRMTIRAERDGIAVVGDPTEWQGRPVQIGERIMQIADPDRTGLRIFVPAPDGPVLAPSGTGTVYLDSEPWSGRAVVVRHWTFEPEMTPTGTVAYRVRAEWADPAVAARIGLRGTAHLDGPRVPLVLHLLRRPLILLRQTVGL